MFKKNIFNDKACNENLVKEIIPTLNRRVILPFFIPVTALIICFLLINNKNKFLLNKINIFLYSFFVLLYAETIIRYTGLSKLISNIFIASPVLLTILIYFFLKFNFQKE